MEEIQPKGGGPSFPFGCERKEEKESDSASGTLGGPRIREGRWKRGGSARRCGFLPPAGPDAPTPAWEKGLRSIAAGGDPKGCRGERREARAQWAQPPKAVSAPEFRQTTSGTHGSANRADCLPRGKPPACIMGNNFVARNSPLAGIDAPTPAREEGLQSLWDARLLRVAIRRGLGANGKPPVRP